MFETLSNTLEGFVQKIRGTPKLTEKNIREGLRDVRLALLEADVHYQVVKQFTDTVIEKALGEEVIRGVDPAQQIIKIVHDELEALMGPVNHEISLGGDGPTIIMLAGLQGAGKTTTCGKLALHIKENYDAAPMLCAADVRRPAAIDQLEVLGEQLDVPVVSDRNADSLTVTMKGRMQAAKKHRNPLILDTGGRLHIDEQMMGELKEIRNRVKPDHIFLVADARAGQDAVVSAKEFNEQIEFDSVILTNLDGDARGGAALSIKAVTGKPIKFAGVGEKMDKLEPFHPDRMADRILGMGDVVSLVEKAEEAIEQEDMEALEEKLRKAQFDLEDFRKQLHMIRKMGPLRDILGYLPFIGNKLDGLDFDESQIDRIEAIINSMTDRERHQPRLINASRRNRIANGSGTDPREVNQLLKQFKQMKKVMRKMSRGGDVDKLADALPDQLTGAGGPMPKGLAKKLKKQQKKQK
ncbi:MAG: signal recognition particle protein [Candidatus Brocadiia bacterium]